MTDYGARRSGDSKECSVDLRFEGLLAFLRVTTCEGR